MAREFRLPDIGEGLAEAEIVRWLAGVGEHVAADQPLVEVETDKAVTEIPAPYGGVVLYQGAAAGEVLAVGEILVVVGEEGETWSPSSPVVTPAAEAAPIVGTLSDRGITLGGTGTPQALPAVRKLARELGLDLAAVIPTGSGGRITEDDVREAAAAGAAAGPRERVRLSALRRAIADNLSRSWREIPHVTTFGAADGAQLLAIRRVLAGQRDAPLPLEAVLVAAILPVLTSHPEFNATLSGDALVLKRHYDIGVAVDTPEGLIVPVVRNADRLGIDGLADEILRLATAARERTLRADELRGTTFTLSNIGAAGGGYGTPIVPYGTTAILSVGRAEPQPVVRDGRLTVATLFPLSLSYDHRAIDGALGRRFMAGVVERIETAPFG